MYMCKDKSRIIWADSPLGSAVMEDQMNEHWRRKTSPFMKEMNSCRLLLCIVTLVFIFTQLLDDELC